MIPPPPPGTPRGRQPVTAEPAEVAPDSFITLPPGIAESATHRVDVPRAVRPAPVSTPVSTPAALLDQPVFFPVVPGAPQQLSWRVRFADGSTHDLRPGDGVFLGRNPTALEDWPTAAVVSLTDPAKTLSKTHALIEVAGAEVFVHDLHSTNGVWLVPPEGALVRAEVGGRTPVPAGFTLSLGDYPVSLMRL